MRPRRQKSILYFASNRTEDLIWGSKYETRIPRRAPKTQLFNETVKQQHPSNTKNREHLIKYAPYAKHLKHARTHAWPFGCKSRVLLTCTLSLQSYHFYSESIFPCPCFFFSFSPLILPPFPTVRSRSSLGGQLHLFFTQGTWL